MKAKTRAKITASTQDHLEIKEIIDDLIITKTGSVAIVIQTNAVNFDLLAEFEQDNKIFAFAGLLNSLNFHIQILIRTKRIDISKYINYLQTQKDRPMTEGLKRQLESYMLFVQNLIVQNDVLDKKFYIVIPFKGDTVSFEAAPLAALTTKENQRKEDINLERTLEQGKIFLYPKRDQILKLLARMGLIGHQLTNNELLELFYDIYNPET